MTDSASALKLLVWTSPAFPVGAFAYSHGMEWAVDSGAIKDAASLTAWLIDLLDHGAPRNDAILFGAAWRAAAAGNLADLREINDLALALAGSRERYLETSAQGNAFLAAARAAWPCTALESLVAIEGDVAHCVAFGTTAVGHGIALPEGLQAFCLGFVANLISAAIRLGAIGQTDGQRVLAGLIGPIQHLASTMADAGLDDLGAAAFRSDIAALQHETQYSRLFRS